ncbi:uncharacterized protein LOC142559922 [Dermacentor variabilis]|uniref:uncharacterized protein LOC142559922 n=1 Tax=Dermacentor variabilis TaxID=34621 RepID=UPI003F5BB27F
MQKMEHSTASSNADEPLRPTPEKTTISAGQPSDTETLAAAAKKNEEKRLSPKRSASTSSQAQHRRGKTHSISTGPATLTHQSKAAHEALAGQTGASTSLLGQQAVLSSMSTSTSTGGGTVSSESSPKSGNPGEATVEGRASQPAAAPVNMAQSKQVGEQASAQPSGQVAVGVAPAPKKKEATPTIEYIETQPPAQPKVRPVEEEPPKAAPPSTHAHTQTALNEVAQPLIDPVDKPVPQALAPETKADAKPETQKPKREKQQTVDSVQPDTLPLTQLQEKHAPAFVDAATQSCTLTAAAPPAHRNAAVDTGTDAPDDFWVAPSGDQELPFASPEYTSPPGGAVASAKVAAVRGAQKADRKHFESTATGGVGRKSMATTTEPGGGATTEATVMLDVNPYVRYPLLIMNLLIWFMGVTLLLVGAYAYVDTWTKSDIPSHSTSYNIYSMFVIKMEISVMLFGMVTMSLSFCGCVGALRENTCLLNVYSSFITALLLINLVVGLIVFFLPSQIKKLLSETFSMELIVHYRDSPDFQRLMDSIQERMQCCGISRRNFRDWNANMYFNCSRANPSSERCSVPYSCCKRNSTEQVVSLSCGRSVLNMTDYDAWFQVYTGNCLDSAHRYVRENVTIITGLCLVFVIVLAFVQMVTQALIDEILIIRRIYEKFYERAYDIRAAQEQTEPSAN